MVLEQVINLDQDRMRNRHARLLVSSVTHDPAIPSPQPAVFHPNRSMVVRCLRFPFPVLPLVRVYALVLPGQMLVQPAKCRSEGNRSISTPISAVTSFITRGSAPRTVFKGTIICANGQFPNRRWWHKSPPQEPVLQQFHNPDATLHVGPPTRHVVHMGGITQETGEGEVLSTS